MIYLYDSTANDFRYNGKPLPTAYDVTVSNTLNGEYYVMGKYPLDKDKVYKEIVEDRIIKVHTMDDMQPFRIVNVSKYELYVEFEAWPLFYADMRNKLVKPLNLKGVSGQAALNAFKNNLLIDTPFDFYSDITSNHDYHTQDVNERENNPKQLYNALDVFKTIVNRWGGELWVRGYDIRVNKRIGTDTEAMLYEKKNITEFVDTTNIEGIVTRLHGKSEWTSQEHVDSGSETVIPTDPSERPAASYKGNGGFSKLDVGDPVTIRSGMQYFLTFRVEKNPETNREKTYYYQIPIKKDHTGYKDEIVEVKSGVSVGYSYNAYYLKNLQKWVLAQDVVESYGKEGVLYGIETTVDSPLINNYSGIVFEKQYTNNDIRTEQELKNWLNLKFTTENIDKPQRTIEVGTNVIDETKIGFADTLILKYIKHDTDVRIKVIGYEYDGFANELKHVVLGQPKKTSSSTIGNTITDLVNNVVEPVDRKTTIAMASADGKSTVFHGTADPNTLNLNAKENDTYFRTNGSEKEIWRFTGTLWELIMDTSDTTKNADAIAEQQQEIEEAKQVADEAVEQIDTAVANAGFTSLSDSLIGIQSISNTAQGNSITALDNAQDAMDTAGTAISNAQTALDGVGQLDTVVSDINIDIDEINGTLDLKADSETVDVLSGTVTDLNTQVGIIAGELTAKVDSTVVDTLTGRVDTAETNIGINAQGLELKANQSTVDTLAGTVSSLGTDIGVVAGQISSKVWNTDIESAIDDIEIGGRNYWITPPEEDLRYTVLGHNNYHEKTKFMEIGGYASGAQAGVILGEQIIIDFRGTHSISNITRLRFKNLELNQEYTLQYTLSHEGNLGDSRMFNLFGGHRYYTSEDNGKHFTTTFITDDVGMYNTVIFSDNSYIRDMEIVFMVDNIKLEKGNIATDWTPAPEDTTALINHVESELTQKHDAITATVSSIDGRVATNTLDLDGLTTTVQDVRTDLTGTTTLLNTTKSTVDGHVSTIATLRTDVDGKATTDQFNTLTSTVDGTITRVGDAEGRLTTVETNVSGLQTTVADKASQSQVTQLANGLASVVQDTPTNMVTNPDLSSTVGWSSGSGGTWGGFTNEGRVYTVTTSGARLYNSGGSFEIGKTYYITFKAHHGTGDGEIEIGSHSDSDRPKIDIGGVSSGRVYSLTYTPKGGESSFSFYFNKTGNYRIHDFFISDKPFAVASGSQISQLADNINLRVQKGELLSQINIEAERTLIQSNRLLLNANNTVITGTAWMDGAVIANASIDTAQIADLAVSSAKIASLDVSKIGGNTAQFVVANLQATYANMNLTGNGLSVQGNQWQLWMNHFGIGIINRDGVSMGGFRSMSDNVTNVPSTVTLAVERGYTGTMSYRNTSGSWDRAIAVDGTTGNITLHRPVRFQGIAHMNQVTIPDEIAIELGPQGFIRSAGEDLNFATYRRFSFYNTVGSGDGLSMRISSGVTTMYQDVNMGTYNLTNVGGINTSTANIRTSGYINIESGGVVRRSSDGNLSIIASTSSGSGIVELGISSSPTTGIDGRLRVTNAAVHVFRSIFLNGYTINESSDARLKKNIQDTQINSLEAIEKWKLIDYDWIDSELNSIRGRQLGLIAQNTPELGAYDSENDVWSIDGIKQRMMNSHAIQQLALRESNTNKIASQALQATETNEEKIHQLQQELSKANRRIEELESVM